MTIKKQKCINCGERTIQGSSRIAIADICNTYNIKKSDTVEVYIRKVRK